MEKAHLVKRRIFLPISQGGGYEAILRSNVGGQEPIGVDLHIFKFT